MVLSKIDPRINYDENRLVYDDDVGFEASLYEILPDSLEYKIMVAVGKIKYTYVEKEIVFFPLYLIKDNQIVMRIGLFETYSTKVTQLLNENSELDITNIINNEPLLFSYANKSTLKDYSLNKIKVNTVDKKEDDEEDDFMETEDKNEDEVFEDVDVTGGVEDLELENGNIAKEMRESFVDRVNTTWVEKFMKNNHYGLLDNEGEGDCFFYVLKDAFLGIGKETTIPKLRNLLSLEADEDTFKQYKEIYDNYKSSLVLSKEESDKIKKELQQLKDKFKLTKDRNTQVMLQKQMKDKVELFNRIKAEVEVTKENIKEFKVMSGVKTLENFRKKIRSCEFWADTWSLSTMERVLNIKLILLSSEAYENGDKDNVLVCGQLNDVKLSEIGVFNPDFYIIVDFVGDHYKLITYKNRRMLKFDEIPYDLKRLIVLKCLEGSSGYYNLIPEFMELKMKSDTSEEKPFDEDEENDIEEDEKYYSDDTVFQIYPKSNDKPLPGKGSGEKIEPGDKRFSKLHKIMNWRKKLSYSWESKFELDNKNWLTIEHYVNANKFLSNTDFYNKFSLDSNSELSKDVEKAINAGGKTSKLRSKDIKIDEDFEMNEPNILEKALMAKFLQDDELKLLLEETHNAKIVHYRRGKEPIVMNELMRVRSKLKV